MALDNFIPEIWSAVLLQNLKNDLVFGSPGIANRNYTGEISRFGDTVRINSIGAVTITDYVKNQDHATPEVLSDSQMTLVIDQAKMFNFQIDDIDEAQQNPKLMSAAMGESSFGLANVTDGFLSNLIDSGTPALNTLTDVDASDSTKWDRLYPAFVDLAVKLDESNCPGAGRWAVVSPAILGVLRKDDRFVSFGTEANRAIIRGDAVGTVAGFHIYVSNQVPVGNGTNPQILAGHPWAVTFAEQILHMEAFRPERRFADAMKGLHVYGGKVIRPELLAKVEVDV